MGGFWNGCVGGGVITKSMRSFFRVSPSCLSQHQLSSTTSLGAKISSLLPSRPIVNIAWIALRSTGRHHQIIDNINIQGQDQDLPNLVSPVDADFTLGAASPRPTVTSQDVRPARFLVIIFLLPFCQPHSYNCHGH